LLNEAFAGHVHFGTVPGGDNHIAFAFAAAATPLDWERLEERAGELAARFPLDFSVLVHSLREGAELRWAKAASAKAWPNLKTRESH
jgi:spermidine synthase